MGAHKLGGRARERQKRGHQLANPRARPPALNGEILTRLPKADQKEGQTHQRGRKRPPSPYEGCHTTARKRPRQDLLEQDRALDPPTPSASDAAAQTDPPAPTAPASPREVPMGLSRRTDTGPLQASLCNLRTRLHEWEEAVLPEAERSMLRHRWRGMGMIQHKAKQVRECWRECLAQLRRTMLEEHSRCLALLYKGAAQQRTGPCLRLAASPERAISREHWLECDDIACLWKALIQGTTLDMDHPVAYDMVLDHMRHVQQGYDTADPHPGPGVLEDRRCHYVIVNSARSNQNGNHWGMGLWDGRRRPDSLTLVDPYADPSRFQGARSAAIAMGLRVRLLGAGQQTCGWRCGYICLWWALSIGNKGEAPSRADLPQALPRMQRSFPALCQSLLRSRGRADRPGSRKRERPLEPTDSLTLGDATCAADGHQNESIATNSKHVYTSTACSTTGKVPALKTADPGFNSQHDRVSPGNLGPIYSSNSLDPIYISPDVWTLSNTSNSTPSQDSEGGRIEYSQNMGTQGHHPSGPPDTGLGPTHIYIPPPPPTATPQQLHNLCHPVPPPKRRRTGSPESSTYSYRPAPGLQRPVRSPPTAPVPGMLDRTGIG